MSAWTDAVLDPTRIELARRRVESTRFELRADRRDLGEHHRVRAGVQAVDPSHPAGGLHRNRHPHHARRTRRGRDDRGRDQSTPTAHRYRQAPTRARCRSRRPAAAGWARRRRRSARRSPGRRTRRRTSGKPRGGTMSRAGRAAPAPPLRNPPHEPRWSDHRRSPSQPVPALGLEL